MDDSKNDLLAGTALTELIDNNKLVLETKIKPELIILFINQLLSNKQSKYVNLLKALVNCDGKAIVKN